MDLTLEVPLNELVEFYNARDQFLGHGNYLGRQDMVCGLDRLRLSHHPEAQYVSRLFPNGVPAKTIEAMDIFLAQGRHPIALCYAGLVCYTSVSHLVEAASLGHPHAQSYVIHCTRTPGRRLDAIKEAATVGGDRMAYCALGDFLWNNDRDAAIAAYKVSAHLGYGHGMHMYAKRGFTIAYPERYKWYAQSAGITGEWSKFLRKTRQQLQLYDHGKGHPAVLLMIGRMLKDQEKERYSAERVVHMYRCCIVKAREAVLCWLLCGRRLGLYKDVNQMVARMVWSDRHEFLE